MSTAAWASGRRNLEQAAALITAGPITARPISIRRREGGRTLRGGRREARDGRIEEGWIGEGRIEHGGIEDGGAEHGDGSAPAGAYPAPALPVQKKRPRAATVPATARGKARIGQDEAPGRPPFAVSLTAFMAVSLKSFTCSVIAWIWACRNSVWSRRIS